MTQRSDAGAVRQGHRGRGRWLALGATLGVHLGFAAGLVIDASWHIEKLPSEQPGDLRVSAARGVHDAPMPARLGAADGAAASTSDGARAKGRSTPRVVSEPRRSASSPTSRVDAPATPTRGSTVDPGGGATGVALGVPLGLPEGLGLGRPPRPALVAPIPLGDYVRMRVPYPAEAIRRRIRGRIVLRLELDEHGRVVEVALLSGLGYGLDERASRLARGFRFAPARDAFGEAVPCTVTWTFDVAPP